MDHTKLAALGGPKVRTRPFPRRRTMGDAEKKAVLEVMDSDVLSAFIGAAGSMFLGGPKVREFEKRWADRYGFAHAISVSSWSAGLMIAYGAVGIEPGDEVICPPYTMSASAASAFYYGGIPVFADIDPVTFCIDPKSIEKRITPRTKAIMVVHLFGRAADMAAIMAIAKKHNLRVIEDAAQAPGVYSNGVPVGAIGDVGGFSLNYHKHIHTGEGGVLVTQNPDIAMRCQWIRNHGENAIDGDDPPANISNAFGGNFRLTELQCAIGIAQLDRLEGYLKSRRRLADVLREGLKGAPGITAQPAPADPREQAYYGYPIMIDEKKLGISRDAYVKAVVAELPVGDDAESVPIYGGYVKPLYLNRIYQERTAIGSKHFPWSVNAGVTYDYSKGLCPVAEQMHESGLMLTPLIREPMTEEDIADFAKAMVKVAEGASTLAKS